MCVSSPLLSFPLLFYVLFLVFQRISSYVFSSPALITFLHLIFLSFYVSFAPVSSRLCLMFTHLPIHLTNVRTCTFTSGCLADSQKGRGLWETCPLNGSLSSPSRLPLQHMHENLIHCLCIYHMLPTYLPQMLASCGEWCAGTACAQRIADFCPEWLTVFWASIQDDGCCVILALKL